MFVFFNIDEDVLFIEDSPQHIEGAKKINLNTLYFTNERSLDDIESWLQLSY